MSLTDDQRERFVCCVKPRLCTDEHYHERDVAQMLADERERALRQAGLDRALNKRRSRLIVQIDLDPVPGWGNRAEDHRALLQRLLDDAVPHYNPTVQISVTSHGVDR